MGKVKIKTSDKLFSRCIRERSGWKCERCGGQYEEGTQALHNSHFHGRAKWGVRFNPDNCEALCYGCHMYLTAHPVEHTRRMEEKLGDGAFEILLEKARDTSLGREAKRSEKEIRAHYRIELARMKELRSQGEDGRIEFEDWM